MFKRWISLICLTLISVQLLAQSGFQLNDGKRTKIRFQLIDNLIIIPVEINGVPLSFLLDTGVSRAILFNIVHANDSLRLKNVERIYLRGLGDGESVEALKSTNNNFKVGKAVNFNEDIFIISDAQINFTPRLGIPIHGIIGYDLFENFIVEINYGLKYIRLNKPEHYNKKCRKCETLPLTLYNNKPFVDARVEVNGKVVPVKLLMDSGGSDALWLFENDSLGLVPEKNIFFIDFLGKGLSGSVHGKRSKLDKFSLNGFHLTDVNVAYPDSAAVSFARKFKERSGSMAGELLKRFNIVMDYRNATVSFKKNKRFKDAFEYNKSGIILEQDGVRMVVEREGNVQVKDPNTNNKLSQMTVVQAYNFILKPAFRIVELRPDSPAVRSGLKLGDVILSVNNKAVHNLKLQEVNEYFKGETGRTIKIRIDRNGVIMDFKFKLESLL